MEVCIKMPKSFTCSNSGNQEIASHSYVEICIDPQILNNISNEEGLEAFLESHSISQEFQDLKEQLLEEVMSIVNTCLTDNQKQIVKMIYVDGKTQDQVSKELGKHQTTIFKGLKGNQDYANGGKRYGGAIKKIRKMCAKNEKVQKILEKMRVLTNRKGAEE